VRVTGEAARRLDIGSRIGWDRNSITILYMMHRCLMDCYFIFYLLLLNKSCTFLRSVRFAMHVALHARPRSIIYGNYT